MKFQIYQGDTYLGNWPGENELEALARLVEFNDSWRPLDMDRPTELSEVQIARHLLPLLRNLTFVQVLEIDEKSAA